MCTAAVGSGGANHRGHATPPCCLAKATAAPAIQQLLADGGAQLVGRRCFLLGGQQLRGLAVSAGSRSRILLCSEVGSLSQRAEQAAAIARDAQQAELLG